jgi:hypothetical protein
MAQHLTGSDVKGFKVCCMSNGMDGTDDGMLWNGSEEDGNVRSECKKDGNGLIGKGRESLTCIGKGRESLTCMLY